MQRNSKTAPILVPGGQDEPAKLYTHSMPVTIKPTTKKEAQRILNVWIGRLNLGHWEIELDLNTNEVDEEHSGEILMPLDYNYATIVLDPHWPHWTEEKLNEVLLHELIHAHLHGIQGAALSCQEFMGTEARNLYSKRLVHELEKATDALTVTILGNLGPA